MPNKIYVLDTNVLLRAGHHALTSFGDNEVVLPFVVIEELEKKRVSNESVGRYARGVLKQIELLRLTGNINTGVVVNDEGGILRIELNHYRDKIPSNILPTGGLSNDLRVLTVTYNLNQDESKKPQKERREVTLVTDDVPLRIYADLVLKAYGVRTTAYQGSGVRYSGISHESVSNEVIDQLYKTGTTPLPKSLVKSKYDAYRSAVIMSNRGLALIEGDKLRVLRDSKTALKQVKKTNVEQQVALEYLFDPDIEVVSLAGRAGTGKTLLAVASGIEQVLEGLKGSHDKVYNKVLVYRPMYALGGQDIGFLPGDQNDKMAPWQTAVYDSIENFVTLETLESIKEKGQLLVEPVTFARGRTLNKTFVIIDEAQNFKENILFELLSRIGKDSKVVLCWDSTQRDNESVGYDDGPVEVVARLKKYDNFAHIALSTSQRSRVAEIAGTILEEHFG